MEQYLIYITAIIVFILVILALWFIPKRQADSSGIEDTEKRFSAENEARKTIAHIIVGIAILIGIFFFWHTIDSQRENMKATRESQTTERFTSAIDQLGAIDERGNKRLEVRLGGIYALERIAKDSPRDHQTIMDVLTAYVRENAPLQNANSHPDKNEESEKTGIENLADGGPGADVQAILTVIGRREIDHDKEDNHLNLGNTFLPGADIGGANLEGANLRKSNLKKANLVEADLTEADLGRADLRAANLTGANLYEAYLGGTYLYKAYLDRVNLGAAYLGGANLGDANLEGADLSKAYLGGANLKSANLQEADLEEANLEGADLRNAYLGGANLKAANLEGANLKEADITGPGSAISLSVEQLCHAKTLHLANLNTKCYVNGTQKICKDMYGIRGWDCSEGGNEIDCFDGIKEKCPEILERPE